MSAIFEDFNAHRLANSQDSVEIGGHAEHVSDDHKTRAIGDGLSHTGGIKVEGIMVDVNEDRPQPPLHQKPYDNIIVVCRHDHLAIVADVGRIQERPECVASGGHPKDPFAGQLRVPERLQMRVRIARSARGLSEVHGPHGRGVFRERSGA